MAASDLRFLLRSLFVPTLLLACGGGGGPAGPPRDSTAPDAPQAALISSDIPVQGRTTVRGEIGSVEARSTVLIENVTAAARGGTTTAVETRASVDGAFAAAIAALLGDELSVRARDDAGNRSAEVRLLAGPNPNTFRLTSVAGSDQFGVSGRPLTDAFQVRVRGGVVAQNLTGVEVLFEVVSGTGTLSSARASTNSDGIAQSLLTLGAAEGPVQVRARVEGAPGEVLFAATAVGAPEIASLSATEADRGASVTIVGRNFSPIAAHNVVEFNGVQADVESVGIDRLSVAVPRFASDGPVSVTLTGVRSNTVPFLVRGPMPTLQSVGTTELTRLTGGSTGLSGELRLGFLTGAEEYVVAVQSLSTHASATYSHSLAGDEAVLSSVFESAGTAPEVAGPAQLRLDGMLRAWEGDLAELVKGKARPPVARLAVEPEIGDRRTFRVINTLSSNAVVTDPRNFTNVSSVLRYKGAHTLLYVDERVPAVDLTDADLRSVGDRFDRETYDRDRQAFGSESDVDGNGRVAILLTATVNELNRGASPSDGIVIGFFFGLDLVPDVSPNTSNDAEIFYGFVPDPTGRFGRVIGRDFALETLNEVFAHEFQHMISFNEHVFLHGGQVEDLWLNEGLSHVAEQLNGFHGGNEVRTAIYLDDPGATALARSGGGNGLAERGAAFLFLRWLADQYGEGVFRALVQTRATGIANVEAAASQAFGNLFSDMFAALLLDGTATAQARFQIPSLTLRETYEDVRTAEPELSLGPYLALRNLRLPGTSLSTTTTASSGAFYTVTTGSGTSERRLRVSAPFSSNSQVTVIRTR